jgi:DNA-binding Lrp family transcriptional regulator
MATKSLVSDSLDEIDRVLIGELVADGRATFAALAPKVGLSQAAVRARVQRLLSGGVVTVTARIDPRTAGLAVFAFALLVIDEPAREVTAHLDTMGEVVFAAVTTGRWGIAIELRCRHGSHLFETLDELRSIPGVIRIESLPVLEFFKQDWTGLVEEVFGQPVPAHQTAPVPADDLDDIDAMLINELVADGRATFAELAPTVGLSQAAVRVRVQRLIDDGVLMIQAYASATALGLGSFAVAFLRLRSGASIAVSRLAELPEVTMIAATTGRYDLACEVWSRNRADLLQTIDHIRSLDQVSVVSTHTYLEVAKEQYHVSGLG